MGLALASFLGGAGAGYMGAERYANEKARQDKLDQIRLADAAWNQSQRDRQTRQQAELDTAARPTAVTPGATLEGLSTDGNAAQYQDADLAAADQRQARTMADATGTAAPATTLTPKYAAGGQLYDTPTLADAQAKAYNDPGARVARQSQVMERYSPGSGIALQNAALKQQQGQLTLNKEQMDYAQKLKKENAFNTAQALRTGDPQAIKDAFNKSGDWKIEGDPQVTQRDRTDVPGVNSARTYDVTVNLKGPNGQMAKKTINSHDFSMQVLPFEKAMELQTKGTAVDNTGEYRSALADARTTAANAQATAAEAKAAAAKAGNGNLGHEERIRYTSLFSDSGRRMRDAQNTMNTLQRDPQFMRAVRKDPNGQEALQLKGLQGDLETYKQERSMYQGLLAGSQGSKTPTLSDAKLPPPQPGVNGAYDLKDPTLQAAINDIKDPQERSNARAALAQQQGAAKAAPAQPTTQAEYDAIPKGAKYLRDGQVYVKN